MLLIRNAQMEAFEADQRRAFERVVHAHVLRYFAVECAALGDARCRELVHQGVERAARYGVVKQQSICRFVNLVFALGIGFDERLDWAAAILNGPGTPAARLDRLVQRARQSK